MYVKQHKNLDKKIWATDAIIVQPVREMLMQLAWAYIDYIRCDGNIDIYNSDVKDIILYGSIANYFYTKKSDIDICIILDIDAIQKRHPVMDIQRQINFCKTNWEIRHHCIIYGRDVDISTESMTNDRCDGLYRSGPIYSILTTKWLRKPIVIPHDNFKNICKDADRLYRQMKHDYYTVKRHGFRIADVIRLYNMVHDEKNTMHERDFIQPITPIYLAFRKFRSHGYMDILQIKSAREQSKEFILK